MAKGLFNYLNGGNSPMFLGNMIPETALESPYPEYRYSGRGSGTTKKGSSGSGKDERFIWSDKVHNENTIAAVKNAMVEGAAKVGDMDYYLTSKQGQEQASQLNSLIQQQDLMATQKSRFDELVKKVDEKGYGNLAYTGGEGFEGIHIGSYGRIVGMNDFIADREQKTSYAKGTPAMTSNFNTIADTQKELDDYITKINQATPNSTIVPNGGISGTFKIPGSGEDGKDYFRIRKYGGMANEANFNKGVEFLVNNLSEEAKIGLFNQYKETSDYFNDLEAGVKKGLKIDDLENYIKYGAFKDYTEKYIRKYADPRKAKLGFQDEVRATEDKSGGSGGDSDSKDKYGDFYMLYNRMYHSTVDTPYTVLLHNPSAKSGELKDATPSTFATKTAHISQEMSEKIIPGLVAGELPELQTVSDYMVVNGTYLSSSAFGADKAGAINWGFPSSKIISTTNNVVYLPSPMVIPGQAHPQQLEKINYDLITDESEQKLAGYIEDAVKRGSPPAKAEKDAKLRLLSEMPSARKSDGKYTTNAALIYASLNDETRMDAWPTSLPYLEVVASTSDAQLTSFQDGKKGVRLATPKAGNENNWTYKDVEYTFQGGDAIELLEKTHIIEDTDDALKMALKEVDETGLLNDYRQMKALIPIDASILSEDPEAAKYQYNYNILAAAKNYKRSTKASKGQMPNVIKNNIVKKP